MISSRLMKDLEKEGFRLDFPSYGSNEDKIIGILEEDNPRLDLALPLLLRYRFDYKKIILGLSKGRPAGIAKKRIKKLNKAILISDRIFLEENISKKHLQAIMGRHGLKAKIAKDEYAYFHSSFREFTRASDLDSEKRLTRQLKLRGKLNTNKALSALFSPAKIRIMGSIFNHAPITNTELKYYYKAIRPLSKAILNENLQDYIRIIESSKKYSVKKGD
ncbi:hypothetical protein KY358_02700 [Candidatus Woesearchaeota archaeon]|nr:hypothetical protein [Candidatus Woesearchaeota archaeon]